MNRHADTPETDWEGMLYQALGAPRGVLIDCSDAAGARNKFYITRTKLADPALECLQIRTSPIPDGKLVIIRVSRSATPVSNTPHNPDLLDL